MSMTAAELYEIVKDVPREAWPEISMGDDGRWWTSSPDCATWPIQPKTAEACFIGTMMNHLIAEGYHKFEWDTGDTDIVDPSLTLYDFGPFFGPHIIHHLAAACKEIA
jgi:hypothetical protein